jgi:uncharacterized membrane protein
MPHGHVQEHIDLIAKHEEEFLARRSATERLGDSIAGFAGTLPFVSAHIVIFLGWIALNTFRVPHVRHFDPQPFSLLGTLLALEAILLASFILMRQTRMSHRAEQRDHLMLQILLLTEKEITAVLGVDRQVAERMGLQAVVEDPHIQELSKQTPIDEVAQTINDSLATG